MRYIKLSKFVLTVITAVLIVVTNISPGMAQLDFFNPLNLDLQFVDLEVYGGPDSSKAPVIIDGKELFSIGEADNTAAEERLGEIKKNLHRAIDDDTFAGVMIEEQGNLPVLYLTYKKPIQQQPGNETAEQFKEERSYLFTVTSADIIGKKSNRETAVDLKREIEQAIAEAKRQRSPDYLVRQVMISLALLLLAILGTRLLDQLQTYPLRRAIQRVIPGLPSNTSSQPSNLTTLFRLKLGFAQFILWVATILGILCLFPYTRHWLYLVFFLIVKSLNESIFNFEGNDFSILGLLFLIASIIASIIFSGYFADLLRTNLLQATRMSRGSQEIISIITKYGLIALAATILLQTYGIDLSSLAFIGGTLGVGVGFGLQDIARNFASGIVLLFERSIQVGDFIQVGNHLGVVEEVRTRSIVLKTLDRISIIVPNSRFLSEEVINWNHRKSVTRLHIPIGVAYGSDVKKVKSALLQAAEEHLEVLRNPQPQVFFTEFGDSSLNFELLIWTSDPSRQAPLKSDLCFRIEEIFKEQQIDIPFPQRDINIASGDLPLKLPPQLEGHLLYLLKGLISKQYNNNSK